MRTVIFAMKGVDLVVHLVPENIINTFAALASIGYKPLVPITASQFANAEVRNGWIREKNMTVLQFWSGTQGNPH